MGEAEDGRSARREAEPPLAEDVAADDELLAAETRVATAGGPAPPGSDAEPDLAATRIDTAAALDAAEPESRAEPVPADEDEAATEYAGPPVALARSRPGVEPDPNATDYGEEDAPSRAPASGEADRSVLEPGTVLFGEYEIIDVLGVGGMGEVYRARHRRLDETRAIKVMHPAMVRDPTAMEFFEREAKALLKVRHPAVVNCHDLLSDEEGRVYLIMEMIDGIALSDRLRNGPLAVEEVRTLAKRVAAGLAAAHAQGVVHRDLSPDNIVLPGGRPEEAKLIDFGIAKVLAAGQETILDGFKGKLPYASPEQLGFSGGRIDGRSDIYSLGLVLYAAATGHALNMGDSFVDAVDRRRSFTRLPDDLPDVLRADVERLLALDPEHRPAAAGLFADRAESPAAGRGSRSGLWAGGAVVALAVAGVAYFLVREPPPQPLPEPAPETGQAGAKATAPPTTVEPAAEKPVSVVKTAPPPAAKEPRKISPRDRLRIVGLLGSARSAFEDDQLTSPPGSNAYEKYREVLKIDPNNADAKRGIERIGARYIALARASLGRGQIDKASGFLDKAGQVAPRHPDLASARTALREARAN